MKPTQRIRTLIEDKDAGLATTTDLHNELGNLEKNLGLPPTTPEGINE